MSENVKLHINIPTTVAVIAIILIAALIVTGTIGLMDFAKMFVAAFIIYILFWAVEFLVRKKVSDPVREATLDEIELPVGITLLGELKAIYVAVNNAVKANAEGRPDDCQQALDYIHNELEWLITTGGSNDGHASQG